MSHYDGFSMLVVAIGFWFIGFCHGNLADCIYPNATFLDKGLVAWTGAVVVPRAP